jgi:ComF family protein
MMAAQIERNGKTASEFVKPFAKPRCGFAFEKMIIRPFCRRPLTPHAQQSAVKYLAVSFHRFYSPPMRATLHQQAQKAKFLFFSAVDVAFPARCGVCRGAVSEHNSLCAECWNKVHFITDPLCHRCGLPFEYELGESALCARCMAQPPVFTEARSVFRYDEHSRAPLLALKYHDQTQLAPVLAEWLARAGRPYLEKTQAILPVPLHYWRFVQRRYNQAALLAQALAKQSGIQMLPDTLVRTRATHTQSGLTRRQREANMRGAFRVPDARRKHVCGLSVLLVDDVMTTGATLDACARALHDAGVVDVYVLTLARTVLAD